MKSKPSNQNPQTQKPTNPPAQNPQGGNQNPQIAKPKTHKQGTPTLKSKPKNPIQIQKNPKQTEKSSNPNPTVATKVEISIGEARAEHVDHAPAREVHSSAR
jgi:hypothetical protein